ncbi:MAG: nicotinamide-nucleotide amidase [Gaiellales bacterium]|nr:nicotinamide-nucleotide amidase [Gaiellales bacterium]
MTNPTAAVLLTGNELLRGVIADRNASHLAVQLERLGIGMRRTLVVGDPVDDIEAGLRELIGSHDLVVTSGGLGPTHDDRTVEALANVAGVPLVLDQGVLARIDAWTNEVADRAGYDRDRFAAGNRKQAHVPEGAHILGLAGTAPGLVMPVDGSVVVVLPGVPSELRRLWQLAPEHELVTPLIDRAAPRRRLLLRTYGIGESHVADLFAEAGGDPEGVETSICARDYELEIDIRARPEAAGAAGALWERMRESLAPHVFATDERPIAEIVLDLAAGRSVMLATAESCTGGMVAAELTEIAGSSSAFAGSAVTYSDELKQRLLGVPAEVLQRHGAVSAETAKAMAEGARAHLGADVAVAVTGVAGPGGGSEAKPVGLVYVHAAAPWGDVHRNMQWPGGRHDVRRRATMAALHLLRDLLEAPS